MLCVERAFAFWGGHLYRGVISEGGGVVGGLGEGRKCGQVFFEAEREGGKRGETPSFSSM